MSSVWEQQVVSTTALLGAREENLRSTRSLLGVPLAEVAEPVVSVGLCTLRRADRDALALFPGLFVS